MSWVEVTVTHGRGGSDDDSVRISAGAAVGTVARPQFSPDGVAFADSVDVEISCKTPGTVIRYTVDGSMPNQSAGTLYQGLVHLTETTTIRAIAYKDRWANSQVVAAAFIQTPGVPAVAVPVHFAHTPDV